MSSWTIPANLFDAVSLESGSNGGDLLGTPSTSEALDFTRVMNSFAVQITVADVTGGGLLLSFELEGSLDGASWYSLNYQGPSPENAGTGLEVVENTPARFVQFTATAGSGSGTSAGVVTAFVIAKEDGV
jgi:hypothetical protein